MIYRMLDRIIPLGAALLVLLLAGCGGSGTDPADDPLVKPSLGSVYVFDNARIDTSGHIVGTRDDTLTVVNGNPMLISASGTIAFASTIKHDTIHMHYEGNGDITLYSLIDSNHDGTAESLLTSFYPVATRASVENGRDTSYGSGSGYTAMVDSTLYLGEQTLTTPAGAFKVSKVADVLDIRNYSIGGVMASRAREVSTYYYARSVGFFVKIVGSIERFDESNRLTSDKPNLQLELKAYRPR